MFLIVLAPGACTLVSIILGILIFAAGTTIMLLLGAGLVHLGSYLIQQTTTWIVDVRYARFHALTEEVYRERERRRARLKRFYERLQTIAWITIVIAFLALIGYTIGSPICESLFRHS